MDVQPDEMSRSDFYSILVNCVVPRPIAWVSSVDQKGSPNLAPFSFFNVLCATPPLLGFCPGTRPADVREVLGTAVKDTLRNVRETGEFVVNMVTYPLREAMNLTCGEYGPEVNEFEVARLSMRPSRLVRPPQVGESQVNFECKVAQILSFGTEVQGGSLVIGEIVSVHLDDSVLKNGRVDPALLELVGRLGGTGYCRIRERFDMKRPNVHSPQKAKAGA